MNKMQNRFNHFLLVSSFCCLAVASPLQAALAPVESRNSDAAVSASGNGIAPPPVFSGTNTVTSTNETSHSNNSRAATSSANHAGKRMHPPSANATTSRPMTAEDRAAHLTLSQIENLQREVSELRGLVETQEHTIKQLKKSQQDLYLDLEQRLNQLQNNPTAHTGSTTTLPKSPAAATVGPNTNSNSNSSNTNSKNSAKTNDKTKAATPNMKKPASPVANAEENPEATPKSSKAFNDQETYQNAYGFVRNKKYPEAIIALQDYLKRFQKGEQAPQAHYWLGEVYLVQWQNDKNNLALLEKAASEFTSITTEFPNHSKTADALLKLGLIEINKGNPDNASQYLAEVKTRYPGSAAARIAENRLQQLAAD